MYLLANNLIVLLYLQVCCTLDDSIAEGRVNRNTDFMQRASYYIALRRKKVSLEVCRHNRAGGFMRTRRCGTRGESSLNRTDSSRRVHADTAVTTNESI